MTSALHPEILTPAPSYVRRLLLGAVIGAVGVVVMAGGYQARTDDPSFAIELPEPAILPVDLAPPAGQ